MATVGRQPAGRHGPRSSRRRSIRQLNTHGRSFVTVRELADYWGVDRREIYKQIEAGTLPALRLGLKILRIRTADAIAFEREAKMQPADARMSQSASN